VEIPYCDSIPPAARARAWHVVERNHMILVWRHAEDKPPQWQIPALPEFDDPAWAEPRTFELEVPVHMQDMSENNCDPVHFHFVHGMTDMPTDSQLHEGKDGRFFRIADEARRDTPFGTFDTVVELVTWHLGISSVRTRGIGEAGLLMFSSTTPLDATTSLSRWIFTVTRDLVDIAGEEWISSLMTGVQQDMRIWKNKVYRARPVLCEADRHLAWFRRWVKQFYSEPV